MGLEQDADRPGAESVAGFRRNAEAIKVTTSVTPTVTKADSVTVIPDATVTVRSMTPAWR
jgi:hypothetical protein